MATYEYILPELGEGIESGDVVQILVAVGDHITKDQSVVELETDKAVIEVPSPVDGVVETIHVREGDKAAVGQLILTLETSAQGTEAEDGRRVPQPPETVKDVDAAVTEADTTESVAPQSVDRAATGEIAVSLQAQPPEAMARTARAPQAAVAEAPRPAAPAAPAAPSVRRLAREIGVNIDHVTGSGPGGRISAEDVKEHARQQLTSSPDSPVRSAPAAEDLPDFSRWGEVAHQPMTNVRRKTAEIMSHAWTTIPHVTQFGKADITDLEELRQRYASQAVEKGGKLTITAIVLKVLAAALKRFPQFNASLDMQRQEIVFKKYYHIGVAVDTDRGLLVPVIRDVDRKSLLELSVELTDVGERARHKKTSVDEMQGGTFTVTNLGGIGGSHFSPIINPPEVAILGLARSGIEAVYIDGQFQPRLMLPLALSYDHRLIDGADGARFMQWLSTALQQPFLIALGG